MLPMNILKSKWGKKALRYEKKRVWEKWGVRGGVSQQGKGNLNYISEEK